MIRITAGEYGGRMIRTPGGDVRPTQDRVRQALFSSLGAYVAGATVLDLYAGSGALGLEALSRGAAAVTWVESNPKVLACLADNVRALAGDDAARGVMRGEVSRYLSRPPRPPAPYGLVLADPPYHDPAARAPALMGLLEAPGWMTPDGVLAFEERAGTRKIDKPGWAVLKDERYGDTRLILVRRIPNQPEYAS